jgi:hypothetical protein
LVVAAGSADGSAGLGSLVRQLSIDQFESESKRIGNPGDIGTPAPMVGLHKCLHKCLHTYLHKCLHTCLHK